jgi:hypothetical protein
MLSIAGKPAGSGRSVSGKLEIAGCQRQKDDAMADSYVNNGYALTRASETFRASPDLDRRTNLSDA